MRPLFCSAVAAALLMSVGHAVAQDADRKAIEMIIAQQSDAWAKGNAAAFSKSVLPDCIFTNTVGMVAVGPEKFRAQHAKIFSTIYKNTTMKETITHLRFLAPGVAIVDTDTRLSGSKWLPPGAKVENGTLFSRLEQVFVKNGNSWGITSYHNVFVAAEQ